MRHAAVVFCSVLLMTASASAQDPVPPTSPTDPVPPTSPTDPVPPTSPTDPAVATTPGAPADPQAVQPGDPLPPPAQPPEEEKRGIYSKKVRGFLRLEMTIAPARYKPGKFQAAGSIGLADQKFEGPEYGFALNFALGGFELGPRVRIANFDDFNLLTAGLDLGGSMRFVPYVHPYIRFGLNYTGLRKTAGTLQGFEGDGFGFDVAVGARVPIIRWISFVFAFNWSFIGMYVRNQVADEAEAALGQELAATFGLTFHFIGVRGKD